MTERKKAMRMDVIVRNEQIAMQLEERLDVLQTYLANSASLREDIETSIIQLEILRGQTEDLKARVKAEEKQA
jgi:hypothetical protein